MHSRRLFADLRMTAIALALGIAGVSPLSGHAAEDAVDIPPPALDETATATTEKAVFAGGCFWGVQGVFQHVKGVKNAVSGYTGGDAHSATYSKVSNGSTGHAEAVEVTFDPRQVRYGDLLQIFFSVAHNPTQLNFQGPDTGPQYRSALFPVDAGQAKVAQAYIKQLEQAKVFPAPIVTQVTPLQDFYAAEAYHQDFMTLNPTYPYIVYHDMPKIEHLRALFPKHFVGDPALVSEAKI